MLSSSHPAKIARRAMLRWQRGATIPELTDYFVHALPQPELMQQLLIASPALLLPLQIALQQAIIIREQQIATKALRQLETTQKTLIPTIDDEQLLRDMVEQCRSDGSLTRWLAGLSPQQRDKLGTPAERHAAIALRKQGVTASIARQILNCSLTELNRWTQENRLQVLYQRTLMLPKQTLARFWLRSDLEAVIPQLVAWLSEWNQRKTAKRTRLRLVKVKQHAESTSPK
ncbi:hypothetical protein [Chromatium okenii]|uniref:hypothetical protein n=1 Tax=Chromatium okenii TaxID=61644 RepID=UPI0019069641|nr:hypothetical protein [Chromatium okenii]